MRITNFIRLTSGGRHAWVNTDMGFPVRKPATTEVTNSAYTPRPVGYESAQKALNPSLWSRFVAWAKNFWK